MIQHNKTLTQFSYILNNGNMVDITDKCPIKLIQTMNEVLGGNIFDENLIGEEVEDIYHYLIEKTHQMPEWVDMTAYLKNEPKRKLLIAFNTMFFKLIEDDIKRDTTKL